MLRASSKLSLIFRDVTERKKAEEVLRRSEEKYRELANSLPEIVFEIDLTGKITFFSQRALEITGFTREELEKGFNILSVVVPEERERAMENMKKSLAGEDHGANEYTLFRKNGTTYPALVRTTPIFSENKVTGLRGLVIDITERKKAEEKLWKGEKSWSDSFNSLEDVMIIISKDYTIEKMNDSGLKLLGKTGEEVTGKKCYQVIHGLDAHCEFCSFKRTLKTGKMESVDRYTELFDKYFSIKSSPIFNERGEIVGFVDLMRDISERKKMEATIKQERDKLESVTAAIGAGLVIISKDYHVLWANNFIKRYKGDTIGKLCYATLNSLDAPCLDCGVAKIFAGKTTIDSHEYYSTTIDGMPYWVEIVATPITDEKGNVISAVEIAVDITEKKLMQQKLLTSEAKFRAITESAIDAIFMFDDEDTVTYWNPAAERIFGYTEKEIIGQKVNATLVSPCHRKDHLKLTSELGKVENKKNAEEIEFPALRKDGTEFSMELSMAPLQLEGKRYFVAIARDATDRKKAEEERESSENYLKAIFKSVLTGIIIINAETHEIVDVNPQALETLGTSKEQTVGKICHKFVCPAEKGKCPISDLGQVVDKSERTLLSIDGEKIPILKTVVEMSWKGQKYLVESFINITDRKKAEEALNQVMDQLVLVNEKVEVVGSLTRHDVRNKLSAMTGYAYLLKKKHADQADILDGVSKMEQAVKDIVAIFDFAKMYEQLGVEELKYINAEKALNEAIALFSGSSSLEFINDCHGLSLLADSLLTRLFYNLIDNSLKHGEKVTKIRVHYEKADQDELIMVFEDDGVGISAENKSKLFKEGFSTSGSSGYGLFLLRKMMSVYGWSIQENGEPGKGAKFTMTIPRINQNGKENFQIA